MCIYIYASYARPVFLNLNDHPFVCMRVCGICEAYTKRRKLCLQDTSCVCVVFMACVAECSITAAPYSASRGTWLVHGWYTAGACLVHGWYVTSTWPVHDRYIAGTRPVHGCYMAGTWVLVHEWYTSNCTETLQIMSYIIDQSPNLFMAEESL